MHESDDEIKSKLEQKYVLSKAEQLAFPLGLPVQAIYDLVNLSGAVEVVADRCSTSSPVNALSNYSVPFRIIIRDDLLEPIKFFLTLLKGCVSLSTAISALLSGGPNALSVAAVASALRELYDLFYKIWSASNRLTPLQWAVIWELKCAKRATVKDLSVRLPQIASQDIEATLRKFMINDRLPKNFTREQSGLWELVGV